MQFGTYRFKCTLQKDAHLPPYKGSTFRGAFGSALKKVSCTARHGECAGCLLAERCLYSLTFEANGTAIKSAGRIAMPPRPYVIRPPEETKCQYAAGDSFDFSLMLFGDTNEYLPYFIFAFETMGKKGLGKKIDGQRATYRLDAVESQGQQIYSAVDQQLSAGVRGLPLRLVDSSSPQETGRLTLTLKTPLRLKFDNRFQAKLPFSLLVRAMLRRVSSLFETYGDGEPQLDYRGLVERAKQIEVSCDGLSWYDWQRYSNRQESTMMMGGMTGSVTYRGQIGEYLPLLELCRELHLGKQTAFGLGQIDYQWQPA